MKYYFLYPNYEQYTTDCYVVYTDTLKNVYDILVDWDDDFKDYDLTDFNIEIHLKPSIYKVYDLSLMEKHSILEIEIF